MLALTFSLREMYHSQLTGGQETHAKGFATILTAIATIVLDVAEQNNKRGQQLGCIIARRKTAA